MRAQVQIGAVVPDNDDALALHEAALHVYAETEVFGSPHAVDGDFDEHVRALQFVCDFQDARAGRPLPIGEDDEQYLWSVFLDEVKSAARGHARATAAERRCEIDEAAYYRELADRSQRNAIIIRRLLVRALTVGECT